ncbi:acetyltransferase [Vibrio cholerae]
MVVVVVFEFSGMRCQPLRRALGFYVGHKKVFFFSPHVEYG